MRPQDWFFDMIIGFLRSPRWKTPVMSYIDEYCTVFDDEDENKLEFTKIHMVSHSHNHSERHLALTTLIRFRNCRISKRSWRTCCRS